MTPGVPLVALTGTAWIGSGFRSIESILHDAIESAKDEVAFTAYSLSIVDDRVFGLIERSLARGIKVTAVINRLFEQPDLVVQAFRRHGQHYGHLHLYDYAGSDHRGDLHAKAVVIDRRLAIVGSSNLSFRGLVKNHELAVMVDGEQAGLVASAIDRLIVSPDCRRVTL